MSKPDEQDRRLWRKFKKQTLHHQEGTCPDETMLAAYIDGVLSAPESDRIERHLVDCSDCLASVLALKVSSKDVGEHPHPPPGLIRQLKMLAPEKQMQANLNRRQAWRWPEILFMRLRYGMCWAVAAVFIIIAGTGGYKLGQQTLLLKVNLVKRPAVEAPLGFEQLIKSPFSEDAL